MICHCVIVGSKKDEQTSLLVDGHEMQLVETFLGP